MRFLTRLVVVLVSATLFLLAAWAGQEQKKTTPAKLPEMKFNDVVEIAPGVFFRYSSISATDAKVPFGGCNNTWVIFKDYVVVLDANFPKEAGDVLEAIKKTTDKPVKYVFDTHHHGDHAYGNTIWAKAGAQVIGSTNCSRLLKTNGPKQWQEASKDRKDIAENELKQVDISFDEKYVLDDGTQRIEFLFYGHGHTPGDAVAYLPKHKILCTGDACVNGAFNFMGHAHSASWIRCLEKMEQLDIDQICPGHGKVAGKDLLQRQKRYFIELREHVKIGIDNKQKLEDIIASIDMAWYKEWTGKAAKDNKDNIEHVFKELNGKIDHDKLGLLNTGNSPMNRMAQRLFGRNRCCG